MGTGDRKETWTIELKMGDFLCFRGTKLRQIEVEVVVVGMGKSLSAVELSR